MAGAEYLGNLPVLDDNNKVAGYYIVNSTIRNISYPVVELQQASDNAWTLRLVSPSSELNYWVYDIYNVDLILVRTTTTAASITNRIIEKYQLTNTTAVARASGVTLTLANIRGRIG